MIDAGEMTMFELKDKELHFEKNLEESENDDESLRIDKRERKCPEVPICQKVTLTIKEAAEYSNIGENKLYRLIAAPRCKFVLYVGRGKRLIKRREFEKFLESSIEV